MPYVNQVYTEEYGALRNRRFIRLLSDNESFFNSKLQFSTVDDKVKPFLLIDDPEMNLETFIELVNRKTESRLQINSPNPFEIKYRALVKSDTTVHVARMEFPYSDQNFKRLLKIYKQAFKIELEKEFVLEGLEDYYKKLTHVS